MDRVAIFIDGAYLDYTLRDEFGSARIDYAQLAEKLSLEMTLTESLRRSGC